MLLLFDFKENGDSYKASEAQGLLLFSIIAVVALICICIIFPLVAKMLVKKNRYSKQRWISLVFIGVALVSLFLSILVHFTIMGGTSLASSLGLTIMLFFMSIIVLTPFSWFWLKLADIHT